MKIEKAKKNYSMVVESKGRIIFYILPTGEIYNYGKLIGRNKLLGAILAPRPGLYGPITLPKHE